jgi:hypothetical protein
VFEIGKVWHKDPIDVLLNQSQGDRYSSLTGIVDLSLLSFPGSTPMDVSGLYLKHEPSIRQVQRMRAVDVNPIDENDLAPEEKDDLDDLPNIGGIPADTDIDEEGDEEKDDGFDLPPAMPPAV